MVDASTVGCEVAVSAAYHVLFVDNYMLMLIIGK